MDQWTYAVKIFLFGFSGVFTGLVLLMLAIQLTAVVIRLLSKGKK